HACNPSTLRENCTKAKLFCIFCFFLLHWKNSAFTFEIYILFFIKITKKIINCLTQVFIKTFFLMGFFFS
uniref:Uncharacterized protein n=1 Tax=Macaca fascicularis TaxID=9541 RepID=A0A7N9CG95_MACFA